MVLAFGFLLLVLCPAAAPRTITGTEGTEVNPSDGFDDAEGYTGHSPVPQIEVLGPHHYRGRQCARPSKLCLLYQTDLIHFIIRFLASSCSLVHVVCRNMPPDRLARLSTGDHGPQWKRWRRPVPLFTYPVTAVFTVLNPEYIAWVRREVKALDYVVEKAMFLHNWDVMQSKPQTYGSVRPDDVVIITQSSPEKCAVSSRRC
jgi:hypothetical protein